MRSAQRPPMALAGATITVVGLGGLGAPAALQLAAAGVGRLRLIDDDSVELSNLHRQLLYREDDVGATKCERAAARLRQRYPQIDLETQPFRLVEGNAAALLADSDFVIDGTDNIASKYLLNDAAVRLTIPYVHAGVTALRAQLLTVLPGESACLRCVFPDVGDDLPSCQQAGVIGPLPSLFGTLQALEAIKFFRGTGTLMKDRWLTYDAGRGRWHSVAVTRADDCRGCMLAGFR